jgi:hypothetical protein
MKTIVKMLILLAVIAMLASCATANMPITATGNPIGPKRGEASGTIYLFMFGDASDANIVQAAKNGGITKISTVDYKGSNMLNIVQTMTCVVTGE